MSSDTTEKGLETILVEGFVASGWTHTNTTGYDPAYAIDLTHLTTFLEATQPETAAALDLHTDSPVRRKLLARLQGEITAKGIIDALRKGIKHGPHDITLFYGTPSPGNTRAQELYDLNQFTVVRQLHFSPNQTQLSLDVALFINGLPIHTFELKNSLTKQTYQDAIEQYKNDRDPKELIFTPKRAIAHLAVDDSQAHFCTTLAGKASWFLPFNKGDKHGAGNPTNPYGLKTSYLWETILTPAGVTDIIENYAQVLTTTDPKTGKKKQTPIFPRYHQLDVVRKLLNHANTNGPGHRYLIQHSAGSGKSNSIAWLTHQLIRLETSKADTEHQPVFDSVIVVTDRRVLDRQIKETIKSFAQVGSIVGHAEHSSDLKKLIESGKKIIITTVQKFPYILDSIGVEHAGRTFAIVIDEAHSSQGGKASRAVSKALGLANQTDNTEQVQEHQLAVDEEDTSDTDEVQDLINEAMASRKMPPNASYFAFTATPKNKTLEMFGTAYTQDGITKHRPFHVYTMKQAIEEGFILDVLSSYTPVNSYYRLIKTVDTDPEFDTKRAQKKLRAYVESHQYAIETKAQIMVDHFLEQVIALNKIGGQARAMVVVGSIKKAVAYHTAISNYLQELGGQYKALVAFSGEHDFGSGPVTEASINGIPSNDIVTEFVKDPYRFLVCADKFQTGYDEPLLHTMYVDKVLGGVKAVQTLSRLNRAHPKKHDVFVLDFQNDTDTIEEAFSQFYKTTILSEETDANKLHDLKAQLDNADVYTQQQSDDFVRLYLTGADRTELDPILDACVGNYRTELDEDAQIEFKGSAKAFTRTYDFLASLLPYTNADWERLSILLNFLIPKLPAPEEEDWSKGILQTIDMDSYRVEKQTTVKVQLPDADAEIDPVPTSSGGHKPEPELDRLSNIVKAFNDLFGNISWSDKDRINEMIAKDIPARVAADEAYQNAMRHSDKQNARIEHDNALRRVITGMLSDDTELFAQFMDNPEFKKWLSDTVFGMTYNDAA